MANWVMKGASRQAQAWAQLWAQPGLPRASPRQGVHPSLLTACASHPPAMQHCEVPGCIFLLYSSQRQEWCWVPPVPAEPALGLQALFPGQRLQPLCFSGHPTPSASLQGPSCTKQTELDTGQYGNHDLAFVPFYFSCIL